MKLALTRPERSHFGLWPFIVVPAVAMTLLIAASRFVDGMVGLDGPGWVSEVYQVTRTLVIGGLMTAIIGWVALRYRREYEERLVERERFAALGELAAQIAHEIRNPLAGIRGACDVVLSEHGVGGAKREIAEEVRLQIDRLDRTVEDLLLFARPRPRRVEPTDVNMLVGRVLSLLQEDPRASGVLIERGLSPDLPELSVDPAQIEQVLLNVLVNALQATGGSGKVGVTTTRRNGAIEIDVTDTGPGIADEDLERIWKPFFTTRTRGTGLGLAIVRNIVQAHGGRIHAANRPEGGAGFTITLPTSGKTH